MQTMRRTIHANGNNAIELDPRRLHEREIRLTKDNWGAIVHLKDYKAYRHLMPEKSSSSFTDVSYREVKYEDMSGFPRG